MMFIFSLICLIAVVLTVGYYHLSPRYWVPAFALSLAAANFLSPAASLFFIPLWALWVLASVTFLIPAFREHFIMAQVYNLFKSILPPISQTEQEAIDAGDVWWEGELFKGQPDWDKLHAMAAPQLRPDEQAFLDNQVTVLCGMLDDWDIVNHQHDLPPAVWAYIREQGFLGIVIDKAYGGLGFSALAHSTIISRIASCSISAAVNIMVPNSLGPAELIYHYGTDEQKKNYLPRLAKGTDIPCFALTGTEAGSDAGAIPDTGIICHGTYEGKEVLGMRLNFDKRYITLAPIASLIGIAFKLYDPDHLLGEEEALGITVALVPASHPQVKSGSRHLPLGLAFMNGPVRGKDVFLPLDNIIGGPRMIGQGWRMLVESLSIGRAISLPALSTAVGAVTYRMTGAYARIRKQFKVPIAGFEGVEECLARIAGMTYQLEAARVFTASAVDEKIRPSVASAIAKYHMTEMSREVLNDALDVHAGRAIQIGPRNYLACPYFAMPVSITVEGANILTRNLMIFGQGAMRCHPYVRDEILAVNDPDIRQGYRRFDRLLCQHLGYTLSQLCRGIVYGLTRGRWIKTPRSTKLGSYYQALSQMSTRLSVVSDVAMLLLGGDLKRKERLSARLGDVLSHLYLASAVLKYAHDHGETEEDVIYAKWCVERSLYHIRSAFNGFFENFTHPVFAWILKTLLFPFDRRYMTPPKDKAEHALMDALLTDSALRERLGAGCMLTLNSEDAKGRVELAFQQVLATAPLEKRIQQAIKEKRLSKQMHRALLLETAVGAQILSQEEVRELGLTDRLVADALQVDEFGYEQLTGNIPSWLKQTETITDVV